VTEGLELREEAFDSPVAQQLIAAVQAEYVVRYGGPDEAPIDATEFQPPNGLFLVGYVGTEAVATGGLRRHDDGSADGGEAAVELKRMYVVPEARGKGLSRMMLAALEARAREMGATRIVLETGNRQPEAVSLYETSGYTRIEGFGFYAEAPLSISFEKKL
jgi:GNAT superfamily N-acetyltransferase